VSDANVEVIACGSYRRGHKESSMNNSEQISLICNDRRHRYCNHTSKYKTGDELTTSVFPAFETPITYAHRLVRELHNKNVLTDDLRASHESHEMYMGVAQLSAVSPHRRIDIKVQMCVVVM